MPGSVSIINASAEAAHGRDELGGWGESCGLVGFFVERTLRARSSNRSYFLGESVPPIRTRPFRSTQACAWSVLSFFVTPIWSSAASSPRRSKRYCRTRACVRQGRSGRRRCPTAWAAQAARMRYRGVADDRRGRRLATRRSPQVTRLREYKERQVLTHTVSPPAYRRSPQFCQGCCHNVRSVWRSGRIRGRGDRSVGHSHEEARANENQWPLLNRNIERKDLEEKNVCGFSGELPRDFGRGPRLSGCGLIRGLGGRGGCRRTVSVLLSGRPPAVLDLGPPRFGVVALLF